AVMNGAKDRSPLLVSENVTGFTGAALEDATDRLKDRSVSVTSLDADDDLVTWAKGLGLTEIATAYVPVGPMADRLATLKPKLDTAGIRLVQIRRDYDSRAWPNATAGFFKFKAKIPQLIKELERAKAA
ncbi:MAG: deoxyribodipyrimidine photolyase, partial [Pseudomonadota bacterium]